MRKHEGPSEARAWERGREGQDREGTRDLLKLLLCTAEPMKKGRKKNKRMSSKTRELLDMYVTIENHSE